MKERKKTGAILEPHVFPSMQSGANLIQSYIMRFQSSPVEIEKSKEKLIWKFVKFFHSSITTPSFTW